MNRILLLVVVVLQLVACAGGGGGSGASAGGSGPAPVPVPVPTPTPTPTPAPLPTYGTPVKVATVDPLVNQSGTGYKWAVTDTFTANITGNTAVGNILTNGYYYANGAPIDLQEPAGANTQIQYNFNSNFGASANLTFDQATGTFQVGYGNSGTIQTDTLTVTGNVTGANVVVTSLTANRVVYVGNNDTLIDSANFSFDGSNANIQGKLTVDNLTMDGTNISSNANVSIAGNGNVAIGSANNGNMIFTVDGTGIASFASTTSLTIPAGNTAQRPGSPETGALRFNTAITQVEVYDGAQWEVVGSDFVSITKSS